MMALHNRHFKLGLDSNLVLWDLEHKEENGDLTGLFDFLVRGMKFSYDYVIDENHGKQLPNGTWTGIKGRLNRSEIDFALAPILMTEKEYDAMAYNYPYASDELVFLTRKPLYTPDIMAVFRTLSVNVWLSLLACIVLVTLACFVAMKHRCTLGDILLHVLAIGLNQEGNLVPRRVGEVLLLSTWTVAMAVFTFCFKSVLLSFLTFPPMGGVRTVPELATAIRAGQYIALIDYDNNFARYLQRSPIEDIRIIGESMLKFAGAGGRFGSLFNDIPPYPSQAFVHKRSHVSFADGVLYVSKDNIASLNFATAVIKNFCCKDEVDMLVHRYLAAGISQKINRFNNYRNTFNLHIYLVIPNLKPDGEESRQLMMTDLAGAFIALVSGHCLSVFVLIIECWIKHRKRRHSST